MRSVAIRSASSHRTRGRYWDGTVWRYVVASSVVYAFPSPPTREIMVRCESGSTFFEPLNIMCSNRWANPVRPGRSFFDPTW